MSYKSTGNNDNTYVTSNKSAYSSQSTDTITKESIASQYNSLQVQIDGLQQVIAQYVT